MQELLQQLLGYLRGMWHRRWIGLAAAWIAAIIGVAIVYRIPEQYEASARVYVDTESLLRPLLAGLAIQPNLDQQVVADEPHADQPSQRREAGAAWPTSTCGANAAPNATT